MSLPICRWQTERGSDLPKVTQQAGRAAGVQPSSLHPSGLGHRVAAALIRLSLRRNSIPLGSASPHLKSLKGEPSPGTTPPLPLGSSAGLVLDTHRK